MNHIEAFQPVLLLQFERGPLLSKLKPTVPLSEICRSPFSKAQVARSHPPFWVKIRQVLNATKLCQWLRNIQLFYLLWQAHQLARSAQEHSCLLIVSFITMSNIVAIFAKMLFCRRLKIVINVHDVTSRILKHSQLKSYERFLLRRLIRHCYPRADMIVAIAQGIKRDLIESFGVSAEKITVIHNPIDIKNVRQQAIEPTVHPWSDNPSDLLIVAVGRLVQLKGYDLLIRAMEQLPSNVRLMIVGDGEERVALENLIAELGIAERVVLLGFQENPWRYMARADLFVLSSLTEGMPNVIGEAMALGLPILATDCSPGVREYLDNGRAGLLVPPGDSSALAQGIAQLLSDEPLRQELARRGRERIAQFDLPTAVRAYEDLLRRLL
ncbi:glycosyltransferase [Candidatus Acetothermia bacterium]|nr:glycosyltransferase [Candidatus Acetothermia bacterium]